MKPICWSIFVFVVFLPAEILACHCGERPICVDYSAAKSVFLGKLLKSRKSVVDDHRVNVATFSVGRIFKGVPEKVQDVPFVDGECDPTMKVGEVYLVFQDKREIPLPCNRSGIAAQIPFIMNYVESVDPRDPKFVVTGSFEGLPEDELAQIEVTVSFDGGKVTKNVDRNGNYRIDVKNAGKLRVEARFPFPIDMYNMPDFIELLNMSAVFPGSTPRLLNYEVEFKPNECNFRQFGIKRRDNAIVAKIPSIADFSRTNPPACR